MKIKFIFGNSKNINFFYTNEILTSVQLIEQELHNSANTILTYTLNDLLLTRKFISNWTNFRKLHFNFQGQGNMLYNYNYYLPVTRENLLSAKIEMNNTIDELIRFGYNIDNSLILDITMVDRLSAQETDKLNQLHFFFEKESIILKNDMPNAPRISHLLEKVNSLVHFIETTTTLEQEHGNQLNLVIRTLNSPEFFGYYKLAEEDYRDFTFPIGGDLVADFSTIGKDLFACFVSNDITLIKSGKVKQQERLTDFLSLSFNHHITVHDKILKNQYYEWCERNSVGNYIDFKNPKYNPGRHVLGRIDDPIYTAESFQEHVFKNTPNFLGHVLCNDNGTIINE